MQVYRRNVRRRLLGLRRQLTGAAVLAFCVVAGFSAERQIGSEIPSFFVGYQDPDTRDPIFLLQTRQFSAEFAADEVVFQVSGRALPLRFVGANRDAALAGRDRLPGHANFLLGDDPQRWQTSLPLFGGIAYRNLYPGIDLSYSTTHSQLKSEFIVQPGADPGRIRLSYPAASGVRIEPDGSLVVCTQDSQLRELPPSVYQLIGEIRFSVAARYRVLEDHSVGFEIGAYDPEFPLTIDPELQFSTLLGGSSLDYVTDMAVTPSGEIYLSGWTDSVNFPVVNPLQNRGGSVDAFVVKFNAAATDISYATFVGGSGDDRANSIALDSNGSVFLAGYTASSNFPKQAPIQSSLAGGRDAFLLKLNANGTGLLFGTYWGGSGQDEARSVAVDGAGNAYLAGGTYSSNFPVFSAYQNLNAGGEDAFLTKISAAGTLFYSTLLGGQANDHANGVAVDLAGSAYLTGSTESANLPTISAFQPTSGGRQDAFAAKFSSSGSQLYYCTYLGGTGGGSGLPEEGVDIVVDNEAKAYVAGTTSSTDFPTLTPLQASHGGGAVDVFVTKLNAAGNGLVYSTYLGGRSADYGAAIALDSSRQAYVAGHTASLNFPTVDALQTTNAGPLDAFISKLGSGGNELVFSSYFGGSFSDGATGLGLDSAGLVYIAGVTQSSSFPKMNPIQAWHSGGVDGFAARIRDYIPAAPLAVSASPSSGTGITQTFRFTYSDPNRYQELGWVFALFQTAVDQSNACYVQYRQSDQTLYLRSDDGNAWSNPITLGTPGTVENSQCSINTQTAASSGAGTTMTLDLTITFKEEFAGAKSIFLFASDTSSLSSGWVNRGSWTVGGFAPKSVSVTPSSGSANAQTFTFLYSDPDGYTQLSAAYALFQTTVNQASACYVKYDRPTNTLWLRNDSGAAWVGPLTPGAASSLTNAQCTLNGIGSTAAGSGANLTVNAAISFGGSFIGAKSVFMLASDSTSLDSGWQTRGAWSIPGNPPQAVSATPASGTGIAQTFQLSFSDVDGYGQITWSYLLLQANLVQSSACYIQYKQTTNELSLRDDAGSSWLTPVITPGASATVQNSQCILNGLGSSVSGSGATLTLNLSVTFKPAFLGSKKTYLYSVDATNLNSGWQQRGTYTVGGWTPEAVSVSPSSGSGSSQIFRLTYSDGDGYSQLTLGYFLVNTLVSGSNACYVKYQRTDNTLWLRNDADSGWLTSVTPGAAVNVENSKCRLNAATSAVSGSGTVLTVDLSLTFKIPFSGSKNIYMLVQDQTGLSSNWQTRGTWTVP